MKYIVRFSGEHPSLPLAELEGVLEGEGLGYSREDVAGGLVLVDVDSTCSSFLQRLALTTKVCEFVGEGGGLEDLADLAYSRIRDCRTFVVRCRSEKLEREFGGLLHEKGLKVSLKNPEVEVNLFNDSERYLAGVNVPLKRDFNGRRPQYRPFFSPTSMHPKLARVMVNLARVKDGDTVLDPFCGTGGILIEAGLMGMKLYGWDISDRMACGCKQNLRHYGLMGDVSEQDALKYGGSLSVDAIVTDPPYGRASYTSDRKVGRLYDGLLRRSHQLLKAGGYVVMMLPHSQEISAGGFRVQGHYDVRVHRSLTRRIWVLRKTI